MIEYRKALLVAALAVGLCQPASAQAPRPASVQPLSRASFIATMDGEYKKLDANKDNVVTLAEIDAQQQRLSAERASVSARALFAKFDSDRNGQLSVDEFVRASTAQAPKIDSAAILNRLDANRDKKVSLVEYRTLTLTNFDRLDVDKDGIVSPAEQRAGGFAR